MARAILQRLDYFADEVLLPGGQSYLSACTLFGASRRLSDGSGLDAGRLPNAAQGSLVFAGACVVDTSHTSLATDEPLKVLRFLTNIDRYLSLQVWVGDLKAVEAPLTMAGLPAPSLQGASDAAGTQVGASGAGTATRVFAARGPSTPLQFAPHPVGPNATVRMVIVPRVNTPDFYWQNYRNDGCRVYGVLGFVTATEAVAGGARTSA